MGKKLENVAERSTTTEMRFRTKRKTVVLSLAPVNSEREENNTKEEDQAVIAKNEDDDDIFLSSVMIPWVAKHWWNTLLIHLFPIPMKLLFPNMPELRACWISGYDSSKMPLRLNIYLKQRAFVQPAIVFVATMLTLWTTLNHYFYHCDEEMAYSSSTPNMLFNPECYPGSLGTLGGIRSWEDIIKGLPCIPIVTFILYRVMIANKYGCMSQTEYQKYMLEEDQEKRMVNMNTLHINGYINNAESMKFQNDPHVRKLKDFEIAGAISRSGIDLSTNRTFVIEKPTDANSEDALNFRRWQALLLGKRHLQDFKYNTVHPLLADTIETTMIDGVECYTVDIYVVMSSILAWSDAIEFSPLLTKLSQVLPFVVLLIPFLSIFNFPSFLKEMDLDFFPVCMAVEYQDQPNSGIGRDIFAVILISMWAYIQHEPMNAIFAILLQTSKDFNKRVTSALLLLEMVRSNDLDVDRKLSKVGITAVQKKPVADFVELYDDDSMKVTSKRNPEIARMPRFILGTKGMRGNILLWANMRCAIRYYGERFKTRMEMFLEATMWAIVVAMVFLLLMFNALRNEMLSSVTQKLTSAQFLKLTSFSLSATSPASVALMTTAIGYLFFTFMNILLATNANKEYKSHYFAMNNRMNEIQRLRSRLLMDRTLSEATQKKELRGISNISRAYEVVYNYITGHDTIKYARIFGLEASTAVLTFFVTIVGSALSVFSAVAVLLNRVERTCSIEHQCGEQV